MNQELKAKLDVFTESRRLISKEFKFQTDVLSVGAALVFVNAGVLPDIDKMKACREIIRAKTKALSGFQGMVELMLLGKMSLRDNPENYLDEVLAVYDLLKTSKLMENYEEIIASVNIVDAGRFDDRESVIAKYKSIYAGMKKEHPILTDIEDYPFVMLLALSDKSVENIVKEIEECYTYMRENFKAGKDAVQGISEIFALYDTDVKTKCDKAIQIYARLKEGGAKYGKNHEFASLAVLADLDVDSQVLATEIIEASAYLQNNEGFGNFVLGSSERLMFAAMVTAGVYDEGLNRLGDSASNTIAVAIAEELEMVLVNCVMCTSLAVYS